MLQQKGKRICIDVCVFRDVIWWRREPSQVWSFVSCVSRLTRIVCFPLGMWRDWPITAWAIYLTYWEGQNSFSLIMDDELWNCSRATPGEKRAWTSLDLLCSAGPDLHLHFSTDRILGTLKTRTSKNMFVYPCVLVMLCCGVRKSCL